MKELQSNFTTPEQSKRLLEWGVPAESADCYYYEEGGVRKNSYPSGIVPFDEVWTDDSKDGVFSSFEDLPCWSVGRLIEIYKIVGEDAGQCISCSTNQTQVESLVQLYEENIELLDFSKLEE